jgi:predicted CoA-binding protein
MELKDKLIAIVGVSSQVEKYGYKIFRDMLAAGYRVEGINPRGGEVAGRKIFSSLKEIQPVPEMVITVVMPQVTEKIVEECRELGIREIWMQPGSESEAAIKKAEEYGISVTHDSCFMVQRGIW